MAVLEYNSSQTKCQPAGCDVRFLLSQRLFGSFWVRKFIAVRVFRVPLLRIVVFNQR